MAKISLIINDIEIAYINVSDAKLSSVATAFTSEYEYSGDGTPADKAKFVLGKLRDEMRRIYKSYLIKDSMATARLNSANTADNYTSGITVEDV